jgi:hypothetical protein
MLLYATGFGGTWRLIGRDETPAEAPDRLAGAQSADIDRDGRLMVTRGATLSVFADADAFGAGASQDIDLEVVVMAALAGRGGR